MTRDNHSFQAVNQLWNEGRLTARINLHMQTYMRAHREEDREQRKSLLMASERT
ncbi:MAG: hypothetical protein U0703_29075 [Anaerolineae bacterium]